MYFGKILFPRELWEVKFDPLQVIKTDTLQLKSQTAASNHLKLKTPMPSVLETSLSFGISSFSTF